MTTFAYAKDVGVHSYLSIEAFANRSGIPHTVVSDFRPGSITITGNVSYHARGNAVDFGSSKANMQAFAGWWEGFAPYILELIHSGGKGYFVHNGVSNYKYSSAVVNQHYDHVHVAITNSGLAAAGASGGVPASALIPLQTLSGGVKQGAGCAIPAGMVSLIGGSGIWGMTELAQWIWHGLSML